MTDPTRISRLVSAVRKHLGANPRAADTLHGIHRWWLGPLALETHPSELLAALEEMVGRGELTKTVLPDGREVYTALG